jgi:hypothetical protein
MPNTLGSCAVLVVIIFASAWLPSAVSAEEMVDGSLLSTMEWRFVGPFRGGRVTTVAGVPDNPQLYYMGATGGGQHLGPRELRPLRFDARLSEPVGTVESPATCLVASPRATTF